MNDEEVLGLAIEKVRKSGYCEKGSCAVAGCRVTDLSMYLKTKGYKIMIFSHRFARHFWKTKWQYHLQEMVITERPLEYLKKFL